MSYLLMTAGAAISLYCLWQIRRWLTEAEAAARATPRRLEALAEELLTTAETTVAALEEKAEALSRAVAEADLRLTLLNGSPNAHRGAAADPQPAAPAPMPAEPPARQRPAPPAPTGAPAPAASALPVSDRPEVHLAIYNLADAGHDLTNIAKRMSMTKGEVQLILGLRQSR